MRPGMRYGIIISRGLPCNALLVIVRKLEKTKVKVRDGYARDQDRLICINLKVELGLDFVLHNLSGLAG